MIYRFCNRQPMWMFIYLLWDHGRNANYAWNAILLPDNMRLDIGSGLNATSCPEVPLPAPEGPAPKSAKGKGKRPRRGEEDSDNDMLDISRQLLHEVRSSSRGATNTVSSASTSGVVDPEVAVTARAKELSAQADLLKEQLRTLPDACSGVRDILTANLSLVLRKLCSVTGGMQNCPQA